MVAQIEEVGEGGRSPYSLAAWFSARAERLPHKPALSFEGRQWTYRDMQAEIERLATLLAAGGLRRGERVVYLGFNDPSYFMALFATARLGAIFVPLNYRLTGAELEYIIGDAQPHTVLVGAEHIDLIEGFRDRLSSARYWCAQGDTPVEDRWPALSAAMRQPPRADPPEPAPRSAEDVAIIMYTSGTTGRPKGAMVTHGNLWSAAVSDLYTIDLLSSDRVLLVAPLFHIAGLTVMTLTSFLKGAQLVLHRAFDPGAALQAIDEHRITAFGGVAAMLAPMMNHPRFTETDIGSLRMLMTGGAPCPKPILEFFGARGVHVMQGYGLTESTGSATFLTSDFASQKLGSVGKPDLAMEVRLVDAEGHLIDEPMRPGEILIRGPRIMKGYWGNPDATAEAIDPDGWLRSGDIGYRDDEGFLYISDRSKDMILSGGENIYSAEVESVLFAHPAIAEVAVVALPDARWGEVPVAVIALAEGQEITLAELGAFAGQRLARYKIPARMLVLPALPRNAAGKALKHRLRELVLQEFAPTDTPA